MTFAMSKSDEVVEKTGSLMPAGQMNQLASQQQFYDLIRYRIEIRDGGVARGEEHAGELFIWDA